MSGIIVENRVKEVTEHSVKQLRRAGFCGFATRFWDHPDTLTREDCQRVAQIFRDCGVEITQATGYWQPLIHCDENIRKEAVRVLKQAIKIASCLGATAILTGPGTMNPRTCCLPAEEKRWGAWWPDKGNHGPLAIERLLKSLREALLVAEDLNVIISLECHVISTLCSPEVARQIVQELDSPFCKINIDPVNFIGTVDEYYNNTERLHHIFNVLDPFIISGDIKDIYLEDPVVVHLRERSIGEGCLDIATFLKRFENICPEGYLHIEHVPLEQAINGQAIIRQKAQELQIRILE
ncbi:MAG: sugar phosphate isomerase/epimerase family protein [Chloroflexota bacterium]